MKIGIEVQRLFRKNKFGIEFSALELIRHLEKLEPSNQYVIFAKDDEDGACLNSSRNLKIKLVKGRFFVDFEQFYLPVAARHEKVDLLHCTGNTAPYFSPVPVVQTLHDVIFMDPIPENDTYYQRFGNHYRRKVVPLVTPRSDAVITVSEYEKKRIQSRLHLDPDKIHVVYNGINDKRFFYPQPPAARKSVRAKYRLPDEYILFLGNTSVRKNAAGVIEAYTRYANKSRNPIPLLTPGLPQQFIQDKLRALRYPFRRDQFLTPGYIDDADLPLIYGLSKVFLFPSLAEGFGMPIIEAMASGAPVITSTTSSMPEIAGDAALLTDPTDTEALSDAMLTLSENPGLRTEKIQQGWENAKRFSWERTARQVLTLYDTVMLKKSVAQKTPGFLRRDVIATRS